MNSNRLSHPKSVKSIFSSIYIPIILVYSMKGIDFIEKKNYTYYLSLY